MRIKLERNKCTVQKVLLRSCWLCVKEDLADLITCTPQCADISSQSLFQIMFCAFLLDMEINLT